MIAKNKVYSGRYRDDCHHKSLICQAWGSNQCLPVYVVSATGPESVQSPFSSHKHTAPAHAETPVVDRHTGWQTLASVQLPHKQSHILAANSWLGKQKTSRHSTRVTQKYSSERAKSHSQINTHNCEIMISGNYMATVNNIDKHWILGIGEPRGDRQEIRPLFASHPRL
ncbi:hypothetical protein PoB_005246900 [Plakobranchus ocellatus]|uniref:FLYWCH-type domain-containing protein n=1 Tax=Plakobranchus ocellatus TaxID=259542 RepID=A0AAV4C5K0_9GAST|nr:hypothetical protein PoB_005246900 [Plakobranchus ocellatus]